MSVYEGTNVGQLQKKGLVGEGIPQEYAEALNSLDEDQMRVLLDVVDRLDRVKPQGVDTGVWGQRGWTVFMVF